MNYQTTPINLQGNYRDGAKLNIRLKMYSHDIGRALFNRGLHSGSHVQQTVCYTHKDKAEDVSWGGMERGHGQERDVEIKVYSIKATLDSSYPFRLDLALIGVFWMFGDYLRRANGGLISSFNRGVDCLYRGEVIWK